MPATAARLHPGDAAPILDVLGPDGPVSLSSVWADGPVVLTFLRHFGWIFCRELLAQLERAQPKFRAAGVRAVAVAMCQPRQAAAFCGSRAPGVICLCDPGRAAYAAYGLSRGTALQLMGPATIAAGARAALSGHMQGRTAGDPAMMPGTFAVDTGGVVRAVHYARHPGDQPDLPSLLAALR